MIRAAAAPGAEENEVRMRILVVDDEADFADAVARGLRQAGMAVDVAYNGDDALVKADLNPYDVIVLDRNLPGIHGDEVCRALAGSDKPARVLMLTAARSVRSRVEGLDLGADDYLGKPFAFEELLARVRALARRAGPATSPLLTHGDIDLDPARHGVTRAGLPITLTRKEFGVLHALMAADGAVVSAEDLLDRVWDENTDPFTNSIRVTVMTLRRKLGEPPVIHTVIGVGYQMS